MKKADKEEVDLAYSDLILKQSLGAANICPNCFKRGHFGSILNYECESGRVYLLCSWCGLVEEKK